MGVIRIKCKCQSYLGDDNFYATIAAIADSKTIGNKLKFIELNKSEDDEINFFILEILYSSPLELAIIVAYVATEFEEVQITEHGDSGGFWILSEVV